MRKLHSVNVSEGPQLGMLKELFEQASIPCTVRGEHMISVAGGVPFTDVHPELWILDDRDFERARKMLAEWLSERGSGSSSWRCPDCHEVIEPQFSHCWKCGSAPR